tara:strand:+ start:15967 stop:17205 length:1239 start_codon:yes stop_codon:yes gene_type:complete
MDKKWGAMPRGVTIRTGANGPRIQINFTFKGVRCRELLKVPVTKPNIKYAANLLGEIQNKIERETFRYADYFPTSSKLKIFGGAVDRGKVVGAYLEDYLAAVRKRGLSPSTIKGYDKLSTSLSELHPIPVTELSPALLKKFVLKSGNSPKTLRNKFSFLRTALAEAVTDGLVSTNPIDGVKLSNYVEKNNKVDLDGDHEDIDPFTPAEVEAIYKHCRPEELNIVELVFNTGMRPSEWSALKWDEIDFVHKTLVVKAAIVHNEMKGPKSRAGKRSLPLNVAALTALNRQKQLSFLARGFVFPKNLNIGPELPNGELNRVNPDSFRKHKWSRILTAAGVRYRYPYQMRHTFATRHISEGMNLWQLANWMGHSSPEMLFRHYGRFIEDYQKKEQNGTNTARGSVMESEKPYISNI